MRKPGPPSNVSSRPRRRPTPAAVDGFTLVEVLMASVILVTGVLAMIGTFVIANHGTATNRVRQIATSLAREVVEDTRGLGYEQLVQPSIAGLVQPVLPGSTLSGSTLSVSRAGYTFNVSFTGCSLDDPSDGYGSHGSPPVSGGSWCPDVAGSGTTDTGPDDYKRVSVLVAPTGLRTTPSVEQTVLIYARPTHGPAVSCLSTSASCPGTNQTVTSGSSLAFNVLTTTTPSAVQWLVNGNPPTSDQLPLGAYDPYQPSGTSSSFTWNFPAADGTYTIAALSFDQNGNTGTRSTLQISLNRHQANPPATVNTGWNDQIQGVDVQWVPSIDQDILYYRVYHQYGNGAATLVSACSQVTGTTCTDLSAPSPHPPATPTCNTTPQSYTTANQYWVVGVDTDPSTGQARQSTSLSPKLDANLCDHAPSAPTGLSGAVIGSSLKLTWSAPSTPTDPDSGDSIQAWRIYRWNASGSVQFPGSRLDLVGALDSSGNAVTSYTDNSPDPGGVTQGYCVTAVDTHLDESPCSSVVSG
jgi:Tfp pilus assembly protein PilV